MALNGSAVAQFSATLIAETLIAGRRPDLVELLARYLEHDGMNAEYELRKDMLWGVVEIAEFVGVTRKRMFGWIENGRFPHCRPGGTASIAGRRSVIHCYLFAQELASMKGISLRKYVSREELSAVANDNAAPKSGLIIEP